MFHFIKPTINLILTSFLDTKLCSFVGNKLIKVLFSHSYIKKEMYYDCYAIIVITVDRIEYERRMNTAIRHLK